MARFSSRHVTTPVAAFTMAVVLLAYTRYSIRSAKRNATQTRQADGGQLSWKNEDLRRHGQMEKVQQEQSKLSSAEKELIARKIGRPPGVSGKD
ncbi:hypothetical protein MMC25_002092 [Agyrium rufum]|nr:hypothetical protein [Agyrium rufum]